MVKLVQNPSLSALNNLQGVEYQSCRFFCAKKNALKGNKCCGLSYDCCSLSHLHDKTIRYFTD